MSRSNNEESKGIRMIVNNIFHGYVTNGTEAMGQILEVGIGQVHLMPEDAIKEWIFKAILVAEEILTWKKDNALKRRIMMYKKSLNHCVGRDNAISLYVNMSLSCSGMSVLSGYGMCTTTTSHGRIKSQSKIHLNPEKRSIYKGSNS